MDLRSLASRIPGDPLGTVADGAFVVRVLANAGVIGPVRPDRIAKMAVTYARWGKNPATASALAAIRHGDETYLEDELGSLTFGEVDARGNALARGLRERGIRERDGIAVMARNHRGFVDASLASSKLGCSTLYLNTMFSGPQLAAVLEREEPKALIYDEEFSELLGDVGGDVDRYVCWHDDGADGQNEAPQQRRGSANASHEAPQQRRGSANASHEAPQQRRGSANASHEAPQQRRGSANASQDERIGDLIASTSAEPIDPPDAEPRFIILTSGTTGTPKGAQRKPPAGLAPLAGLIDAIPFRSRQKMMIAAPLFHSWGFTHLVISLTLANSIVLRRKFDPEATLRAVEESRADTLAVVPVMLQRILGLDEETLVEYRLPSLRITSVSGSALPGELAIEWMDRFGDSVYNLYGSTEVAFATVASPADLRAAPGTAGRPPHGTVLRIVDENGDDVAVGKTGRIFVGNEMAFEGYTGGGNKDALGELLSSGDVGHLDSEGRLFIDGRDDEMIVSGGENVFPREVEDLLADHEAVKEVAVIGVDDEDFGQRLKAFVVLNETGALDEDEAKAFVKENLAGYKVPREIDFLDSLPRNATGKVLKRELA